MLLNCNIIYKDLAVPMALAALSIWVIEKFNKSFEVLKCHQNLPHSNTQTFSLSNNENEIKV